MTKLQELIIFIEERKEYLSKTRKLLSRRLGKLSILDKYDRLCSTTVNGKKYYIGRWMEDGRERSLYLGDGEKELVKQLQEKRFLEQAIKKIDDEMKAISKIDKLSARCDFDAYHVNETLPKVYRLDENRVKELIGLDEGERWHEKAKLEKKRFDDIYGILHPENLIHVAKDGTLMRSKSEVIIGNELIDSGVLYIYEMPLIIGGKLLHPDFAYYSYKKKKVMYHEHIGMLGNEGYMSTLSIKIDTYLRSGLVPCVDVLFTFDTMEGELDARSVLKLLENYI